MEVERRGDRVSELVEQLLIAAVIEARTVPKMLERSGEVYWRARDGLMIRLTAGPGHIACEWSTT
jgi:hypothetical protein